jgi:hypothetical protein
MSRAQRPADIRLNPTARNIVERLFLFLRFELLDECGEMRGAWTPQ